ncbi:amino acid adenylation domain-containing protein [Phytohabitans kaempferiae]|uniref:Amino acid adenylation domain-containing protein n=1 Tax=Phytohabitans kaempferiae TaxID=1620943 RepID=A0ABV6MAC2_9ACTN
MDISRPVAALYRVPGRLDPAHRELAASGRRRLPGRWPELWVERVLAPADSEPAARRRARELSRGLGAPASGASAARLVLLAYQDGAADLVVTGQPDAHGLPAVDVTDLLRALAGPQPDGAEPRPAAAGEGAIAGAGLPVPLGTAFPLPARATAADLAAAAGLVLAWYAGEPRARVRWSGAGEPARWARFGADPGQSVAAFRLAVAAATRSGEAEPPEATAAASYAVEVAVVQGPPAAGARPLSHLPRTDLDCQLAVVLTPGSGGPPRARWWIRDGTAPRWLAEQVAEQARHALAELVDGDQDRPLTDVPRYGDAERDRVVALGRTPRPADIWTGSLHDAFLRCARAAPDAPALTDRDSTLTYREVADRAARMAHGMRELGVREGDRVGVCLDRSAGLVVTLLGVLMAGAAYVPMDPANPGARLAFVTEDAGLALVVAEERDGTAFGATRVISPDALAELAAGAPATPPVVRVGPEAPAYIIYTSGSTGQPKGAVIPHGNVARLLSGTRGMFGFGPADTWTWFHSAAFDFSVWEIWGCLLTGGRLIVVPYWTTRSPEDFRQLLVDERVTVLNHTPSAFTQLHELELAAPSDLALRLVIFGGEALDARRMTTWFDIHPESRCQVVNMYGITETTVHVTAQVVTRAEALAASRSVGRPIPGWSMRVVDERRRPLPPGIIGEIAVAGDGLAVEYLNRPELTAARFVTDERTGERLYLSGDRGRLLPDGRFEHLGRIDSQVKVRGHRIELDEIRTVLQDDPVVLAAAVVLGQADPDDPASARLDAYVVLNGGDPRQVRRRAATRLPEYMVPATVTVLGALPLTVNGKLDRARLPAPAREEAEQAATGPAEGPLSIVLGAWRAIFGEVAEDDNFFDLGGNSLLAVRIARMLRDQRLPVGVREMYLYRTPLELARFLEADEHAISASA